MDIYGIQDLAKRILHHSNRDHLGLDLGDPEGEFFEEFCFLRNHFLEGLRGLKGENYGYFNDFEDEYFNGCLEARDLSDGSSVYTLYRTGCGCDLEKIGKEWEVIVRQESARMWLFHKEHLFLSLTLIRNRKGTQESKDTLLDKMGEVEKDVEDLIDHGLGLMHWREVGKMFPFIVALKDRAEEILREASYLNEKDAEEIWIRSQKAGERCRLYLKFNFGDWHQFPWTDLVGVVHRNILFKGWGKFDDQYQWKPFNRSSSQPGR